MFGYFGQERLIREGLQKVDEAIELVVGELGEGGGRADPDARGPNGASRRLRQRGLESHARGG